MSENLQKNGLSVEQIAKAREILIKASIRKVAKNIGTSDTSLHFILSGEGSNIKLLDTALREANKIIEQKQKIIENLPL